MRHPHRLRQRAPWLVLGTIVLVCAVVTTTLVVHQRDLRRVAAADQAVAHANLVNRVRLDLELTRTRGELAATSDQVQERIGEIATLDADLADTLRQLGEAGKALGDTSGVLALRVLALETTRQCLTGVRKALDRVLVDDFAGSLAALRATDAVCRRAVGRPSESLGNPALDANFPDPYVLRVGGDYHAYATNGSGGAIQMASGGAPRDMRLVGDALNQLPAWATQGQTWGPSVLQRGGAFILYYTAKERSTGVTCIARAPGLSPAGPFVDDSEGPFLCQSGGSIDPSPFVDPNGSAWLVWKAEQSNEGPQRIFSQQLRPDGMAFLGPATPLVQADRPWEAGVVEGPTMVRRGNRYVLLYSAANWRDGTYAIGYAICVTPAGPCLKPNEGPLLASNATVKGPGGQEVFTTADGRTWVAYHGWAADQVGYPNRRRLYVAELTFDENDTPVLTPSA